MEKTGTISGGGYGAGKHLHGRGEDFELLFEMLKDLETPPRTWRRLGGSVPVITPDRNTSTDVEKTLRQARQSLQRPKHLHGRGEDQRLDQFVNHGLETPPRTWRRLASGYKDMEVVGNTSTDVEKTEYVAIAGDTWEKHLHGRGEDYSLCRVSES